MAYRGIVRGRLIELAEELPLPEGTEVEVSLSLPGGEDAEAVARASAGILRDLSPGERAAFDEALSRRLRFRRRIVP